MSDVVRARLDDGLETNLSPFFAKRLGAVVLDEPTTRPDGGPRDDSRKGRRVKPKTSVDEASTAKKASDASTQKEK